MTENTFKNACTNALSENNSKMSLLKIEAMDTHTIITYYGGNNSGNSDWYTYLEDINIVFSRLENLLNDKIWLIDLVNDCSDDVFYLRIGTNVTIDKEQGRHNMSITWGCGGVIKNG